MRLLPRLLALRIVLLLALRAEVAPILGLALDAGGDEAFMAADFRLLHFTVLAVLLVAFLVLPLYGALVLHVRLP